MSDRTYRIEGQDKPSITTVVHQLASPYLDQWKIRMAIEYIRDNIDTVDYESVDDILNVAATYHEQVLDTAAKWGTACHKAIEEVLMGEQNPYCLDEVMEVGVKRVKALLDKYECKVIAQEEVVWGDYRAGTIDLLCEIVEDIFLTKKNHTGKRVIALIDFKTSKGYYESQKIQLGGYLTCTKSENNLGKYLTKVSRCGIMRISKDNGNVNVKDFFDSMDKYKAIFENLVNIYKLKAV